MKKRWLITFIVLFFCICALSFNNFAYAQSVQASGNAKNEIGFENQMPVEVLDILQKTSKYSEASKQEIEIICNHYGVSEQIFKDLETKGYNFITSAKIVDLNTRYNIDLKTIEECIKQGKDLNNLYPEKDTKGVSSSNSAESDNKYIEKIIPPKELDDNYEEYVNPQNGSYTYKQEDIVLPGRNGLDLIIAPRYNSANSLAFYNFTYNGSLIEQLVKNDDRNDFYGSGWSIGISYITITPGTGGRFKDWSGFLYLSDGQSYEIDLINDKAVLKNYRFSDMTLNILGGAPYYATGIEGFELFYKNGRKETFDKDGSLKRIEDKYGNCISFSYRSSYRDKHLSMITDTMGRVIQFNEYTTENGKTIKISVPDKGDMTYIFEKVPEYKNDLKLVRKIDFLGRISEFIYSYDIAYSNDFIDDYGYTKITNVYANLTKVIHPNQSYTQNTYGLFTIYNLYNPEDKIGTSYYRIASNELIDGNTSYKRGNYTYDGTCVDYLHYKNITSPASGKTYFGYSTTVDYGKTKVTSIYHDDYANNLPWPGWPSENPDWSKAGCEKVEELVYDNNSKLLIQRDYTYYKKELPINIKTTKYGTISSDKISSTEIYVYDDYKDLLEYTNELGNKTTYTYEQQYHRRTSERDNNSSGERTEWSYDSAGETMTIYYKEYGDLNNSSIKTHQVRQNYDTYGNVTSEIINNTTNKYYTYENNNYLSSIRTVVKDKNGKQTTIEEKVHYNPYTGNLQSYTDGNGNQTRYSYDRIGRLIGVTHPDNSYATLEYSNDDKNVVMTDERGATTSITYNALGKMKSIRGPKTSEDYEYDSYGRKISSFNGKGYTYYEYDCQDRVTKTTNPEGIGVSTTYNDVQNYKEITDEEGGKHYFYYDLAGNIIKETSPGGKNTTNNYNSKGQLTSTINANGFSTEYEYNYMGNVIRMVDTGGKPFVYQYDNITPSIITNVYTTTGLISSKVYDELGRILSESGIGNFQRYYECDGAGNIIKETNPISNSIILYTYDSRNRLLSKSIGSVSYNYTYDGAGNETSITNSQGTVAYEYNMDSTIKRVTLPDGKSISYEYDSCGNRICMNDYYGKRTTYFYDIMNRLKEIYTDDIEIFYSYYPDGQLKDSVSKYKGKTISRTDYLYDSNNNLTCVQNYYPDYKSYQYTYDAMGNQLSKADSNGIITYSYDEYNRVKTVINPDGSKTSYGYDPYGNIDKEIVTANDSNIISTSNYVYNGYNRLDHVIEEKTQKLSKLSMSPTTAYALAEEQISFTLTGFISYGITINDDILNEAVWTVSSPSMTLNATKGKAVTGIISKAAWDAMPETDEIIVRAVLQDKIVEAKIYKNVIQTFTIDSTNTYVNANQLISFKISGTMGNGSVITNQMLNEAIWTVSSPFMTLNATKGKAITGIIPKDVWDSMSSTDVVIVRATLNDKVAEVMLYKNGIETLTINPKEVYTLADRDMLFILKGTMRDGTDANTEVLRNVEWTVSAPFMILNTNIKYKVSGRIPKANWDTMSESDAIILKATLQDKSAESRVYKKGTDVPTLQNLSITPTETYANADQQITFTISGAMSNGNAATDELLSSAAWTVSPSTMTLNTAQGKTVTGVISKANWDAMSPTDIITVRAALQDKAVEARIYKGIPVLQSIIITPADVTITPNKKVMLTLSGEMSNGTAAPDNILDTATWKCNLQGLEISSAVGKSIIVGIRIDYWKKSPNGAVFTLTASVQGNTAQAVVRKYMYQSFTDVSKNYTDINIEPDNYNTLMINGDTINNSVENKEIVDSINTDLKITENMSANNPANIIENTQSFNTVNNYPVDRTITYFKYDNNSNMIEERVVKANGEEISSYRYDDFNQLVEVRNLQGTTTFTYYPSGLRETKTYGGEVTKYYYDGQNVILEEINNSLRARNVFGKIGAAARQITDAQGNVNSYYYIYNGHMDVVALLDEKGDVINNYEYDIYGETFPPDGTTIDNPFRYAGQYYDKETGLYYLRARYYDPEIRRFISPDTHWNQNNSIYGDDEYKEGGVKIPDIKAIMQSSNLYVYCMNNPLFYIDPTGCTADEARKGYEFMNWIYKQYPGLLKNTISFNTDFGKRIPDIINKVIVGEIKNVKYQYLSSQIKGFIQIAEKEGLKFVLIVKKGTTLSGPLKDYITNHGGKYIELVDDLDKKPKGLFIFHIDGVKQIMDSFNKRYFTETIY